MKTYVLLFLLLGACTKGDEHARVTSDSVASPVAPALPRVDSGAVQLTRIDQADPSFQAFRDTLIAALARRDTTYLYSILARDIKNSFGGDDSIAGFKRIWRMNEPQPSEVWETLARVLELGVVQEDSTVIAPYVFSRWPDTIDAFEYVAVVRAGAPVYGTADRNAQPIGSASYSILKRTSDDMRWYELQLPNGRQVWMRGQDVYSPVDWRAFFEKRNGRWVLPLFVAGD